MKKQKRMKIGMLVLCTALLLPAFILGQTTEASAKTNAYRGEYSNLVDTKTQKEVKKAMLAAGLSEKRIDAWLGDVQMYNQTIRNTGLVKKGFKKLTGKNPQYDENRIMKLWNKKNPQFIGYNCRITAYDLIGDKISMKKDAKVNASNLFMDQDAIRNAPVKKYTGKQQKKFEALYSTVKTSYTTDVDQHAAKQKRAWQRKGIKVSDKTKASLITVVFHDSFGKNDNELFIGHAGVLVPEKNGKLLFVEKLSFSLPYQVLRFDNRKQLNRYLMSMYDTQWGQDIARPFIMENTQLLY